MIFTLSLSSLFLSSSLQIRNTSGKQVLYFTRSFGNIDFNVFLISGNDQCKHIWIWLWKNSTNKSITFSSTALAYIPVKLNDSSMKKKILRQMWSRKSPQSHRQNRNLRWVDEVMTTHSSLVRSRKKGGKGVQKRNEIVVEKTKRERHMQQDKKE